MSSAAFNNRRARAGRPRLIPETTTQSARDQILEAAAGLFVDQGFAKTSTREIAERVGIRQASLYYHFAGKDDILGELLEMAVRPALDILDDLDKGHGDEVALYMLAFHDAQSLAGLMHNIGVLPTHPDVTRTPECREYAAARADLRSAYGALAVSCASEEVISTIDKHQLGGLMLQVVESVIGTRADGDEIEEPALHAVAASCLRVCGVQEKRIDAAAAALEA